MMFQLMKILTTSMTQTTMNIKIQGLDEKLTQDFVYFCCKELDVQPDSIEIVGDDWTGENTGLCIDLDEKDFLICAAVNDRNLTQIYTTIAHELVHIKQYMKQDLGSLLNKDKPEYLDRWWEKEAREKSLDLVKKFVDILERIR